MKITKKYIIRLLAGILVLGFTAVCLLTNPDIVTMMQGETKIAIPLEESRVIRLPLEPGQVYRQPFQVDGNVFMNLHFPLSDIDPESNGVITISVKQKNGDVLFSMQKTCQDILQLGTYNNRDYFITIANQNAHVQRNETLYLELMVSPCDGQPISVCCISDYPHDNLTGLEINGTESEHKVYFEYQYYQSFKNGLYDVVLLLLLIFAFLFIPVSSKLSLVVLYLMPVSVFVAFELITGNLSTIEPLYIFYTLVLLYAAYFVAQAFLGRRAGAVLLAIAGNILSLVNYFVYQFRGKAASVTDIAALKTAATIVANYKFVIPYIYIITTLAIICCLIISLHSKNVKTCRSGKRKVGAIILSCACFLIAVNYLPTDGYIGFQENLNFTQRGWLYTNYTQLRMDGIRKPKNYSEEIAHTLLQEHQSDIQNDGVSPQNLIVIMNEAFSDMSVLGSYTTNEPVMPYWDSLSENVEKGYLGVPTLGGGTSNTEWEVLSGYRYNLAQIVTNPYATLYKINNSLCNTEGLASAAQAFDYKTIAMHPYDPENWNRDVVYPEMGFADFVSLSEFTEADRVHNFVSDKADYDYIIELQQQDCNDQLFIFNVTMQNHGGYTEFIDDVEKTIWLTDAPDELDSTVYFSLLRESDNALKALLTYFESCDEPTMIVLFGDHQPVLSDAFYDRIYGKDAVLTDQQKEIQYITPYMIWTNYDRNIENPIPYMSSNFFGSYIKQAANWETTEYDNFLLDFMQDYPVVGSFGIYDSNYTFTSYQNLSDAQSKDLENLKFVQYYHMTE